MANRIRVSSGFILLVIGSSRSWAVIVVIPCMASQERDYDISSTICIPSEHHSPRKKSMPGCMCQTNLSLDHGACLSLLTLCFPPPTFIHMPFSQYQSQVEPFLPPASVPRDLSFILPQNNVPALCQLELEWACNQAPLFLFFQCMEENSML